MPVVCESFLCSLDNVLVLYSSSRIEPCVNSGVQIKCGHERRSPIQLDFVSIEKGICNGDQGGQQNGMATLENTHALSSRPTKKEAA